MKAAFLWNYWIMANYAGCMVWWLVHRSPWNAAYWLCALGITAVVTFGLQPR